MEGREKAGVRNGPIAAYHASLIGSINNLALDLLPQMGLVTHWLRISPYDLSRPITRPGSRRASEITRKINLILLTSFNKVDIRKCTAGVDFIRDFE